MIARIEARLGTLERGVRLEDKARGVEAKEPTAEDEEARPAAPGKRGYADLIARVAVACFALLFALVLRVLTRGGVLAMPAGFALALGYCVLLVATGGLARRWRTLVPHAPVLEVCGVLLADAAVLESLHRTELISPEAATLLILAMGAGGGLAGALANRQVVTTTTLAGSVVALAGIGISPVALVLRGAAVVAIAAMGMVVAYGRGWRWIRPLVVTPAALFFVAAVLGTARRTGTYPGLGATMLAEMLLLTGTVATSHLLRLRTIDAFESVGLPLISLVCLGLAAFFDTDVAGIGGGAAALALALFAVAAAARAKDRPGFYSLVLTSLALASGATLAFDDGGLALAGVSALLAFAALRAPGPSMASIPLLGAGLAGVFGLGRAIDAELDTVTLAFGLAAAAIQYAHYALTLQRSPYRHRPSFRLLVPMPLVGGTIALLAACHAVVQLTLGPGQGAELVRSCIIAALALGAFASGQRWQLADLTLAGLGATGLLGVKLLLRDLAGMSGASIVGAMALFAVVSLIASLAVRRMPPRPPDTPPAQDASPQGPPAPDAPPPSPDAPPPPRGE